jgi:transcriptional regulator with XRE-family HTH domain
MRLLAGLTRRQAADRAGVSLSMWQKWEAWPTLDNRTLGTVRKIADALVCSIVELVDPAAAMLAIRTYSTGPVC